nr:hypothetical protein [Tanacetum cinerariifolium]
MDHQYPTVAKIPVLDTGKFEQWQFRIQQYLQHEHYALWEVIEFGDSYKVPINTDPDNTTTRKDDEQSGRTVAITTEDMQRKKNDLKARTTLLLSLPDEHQLRFSKYKTAKELWAAILKTFGGNEATKKRKKNVLKQQYGNFKAEGLETLEQTFNKLQVILYDLSGVHHVTAKDKEIFMLVEKDYPLRRGLALVMISYRLQAENHSQMAEDLIRKIYNIANTPRKQSD